MAGETYAKRYAGGFVDGSGGGTPVDSQFLNAVEAALVRLLGADPTTDSVPVWNGTRFAFQKITNSQIAAAAAIDKTKLASLAIVDADVSGAAAIAQSKLALSIVNADVSASAAIDVTKMASAPRARVYHSVDQAIADATLTVLAFNTEFYDTDVIHDTATNNSRLTCKTAGTYAIKANVSFASNATGYRRIQLLLNGATIIAVDSCPAVSGSSTEMSISCDYALAVNDYVEVRVYQTSTTSLNALALGNYSPQFSMARLP